MADYSPPASHPIIKIGPRGGLIVGQRTGKDGKPEYDYQRPEHQHLGAGPHREAPYRRPVQQSLFDAPRTLALKPPEESRRRAAEKPQGDLFGATRTVAVAHPAPPSGSRVAKLARPLPWAAVQHHEPEPAAAPAPKAEWKAPEPTPAAAKLEGQARERKPEPKMPQETPARPTAVDPALWTKRPIFGVAGGSDEIVITDAGRLLAFQVANGKKLDQKQLAALERLEASGRLPQTRAEGAKLRFVGSEKEDAPLRRLLGYVTTYRADVGPHAHEEGFELSDTGQKALRQYHEEADRLLDRIRKQEAPARVNPDEVTAAEQRQRQRQEAAEAPAALSEEARKTLKLAYEMPLDPATGRPRPLNYDRDKDAAKELVAAGLLKWNGKPGWNGAEYADVTPAADQWFHDRIAATGREKGHSAGQVAVLQARHDFRTQTTRMERSLEGGSRREPAKEVQEAVAAAEKRVAEMEDKHGMAPSTVDGFRRRFKIPDDWEVHPTFNKPARFSVRRPGGEHYRIVIQGNDVGGSGRAYFESREYLGAPVYHFVWSSTQKFGKGWQPFSEAWPKYQKWAKDQDARDAKHERDHAAMLEEQGRR